MVSLLSLLFPRHRQFLCMHLAQCYLVRRIALDDEGAHRHMNFGVDLQDILQQL